MKKGEIKFLRIGGEVVQGTGGREIESGHNPPKKITQVENAVIRPEGERAFLGERDFGRCMGTTA